MKRISVLLCVFLVLCGIVPFAQGQQTAVRFVHTVYNAPPVTVNFGKLPFFLKKLPLSASAVRSELPALSYQVEIRDTQTVNSTILHSAQVALTNDLQQSLVLVGQPMELSLLTLAWDKTLPQIGNVKLRFVHAAASVSPTLSGFVGGSLFFPSIQQFTGTTFIEVPLAQASSLSFFITESGGKIAKVEGKLFFEAGNVYTVYLVDGINGPEVRVGNETSIDEQVPLPVLPYSGTQYTMRTVHMASSFPALTWEIDGSPVFSNIAAVSASKETTVFAERPVSVVIYPHNQPANILVDDSFEPSTTQNITMVSYRLQNDMKFRPLSWDRKLAPAERVRVRVFNAVSGLEKTDIALGSTMLFTNIAFGTVTDFQEISAAPATLLLKNATPQTVPTEVSFAPTETHVYTLFLSGTVSSIEVRVLQESVAKAQQPLPMLTPVEQSKAELRTANLLGTGKAVRVTNTGTVTNERVEYAHASKIMEGVPIGDQTFAAGDADMIDAPTIATAQGTIVNGRRHLLVYAGTEEEPWGALYASPTPKSIADSIQMRFVNAAEGEKELTIVWESTGKQVVERLEHKAISQYITVAQEGIIYQILGIGGVPIGTIRDDVNHHGSITVFLVRENSKLVGYILPDEEPEALTPMQKLDATVSVREQWEDFGNNVSAVYPNPSNRDITVTVSLPISSSLEFWITDVTGKIVQDRQVSHYSAGTHTVRMLGKPLTSGTYYLHMQTGRQYTVKPFSILR